MFGPTRAAAWRFGIQRARRLGRCINAWHSSPAPRAKWLTAAGWELCDRCARENVGQRQEALERAYKAALDAAPLDEHGNHR